MDTWNRLTDLRGAGDPEALEEISQRTGMCICKAYGHIQQCSKAWKGQKGEDEGHL